VTIHLRHPDHIRTDDPITYCGLALDHVTNESEVADGVDPVHIEHVEDGHGSHKQDLCEACVEESPECSRCVSEAERDRVEASLAQNTDSTLEDIADAAGISEDRAREHLCAWWADLHRRCKPKHYQQKNKGPVYLGLERVLGKKQAA